LGGLDPLGYPDIDAWSRVTGNHPTPFEVQLLRAFDRTVIEGVAN